VGVPARCLSKWVDPGWRLEYRVLGRVAGGRPVRAVAGGWPLPLSETMAASLGGDRGNGRGRVSVGWESGPTDGGILSCWLMLIGIASLRGKWPKEVQAGRYTADIEGDFVVFLIGMRFNHPLRVRTWLPVETAMPKMLKVLSRHPELDCLGFQQWFGRTTIMVQHWRDFDSLDRFAGIKTCPTWSRGGGSTAPSGTRVRSGPGMRRSGSGPGSTRPSTATCRSSALRPRARTCRPPSRATRQRHASAPAPPTTRPSRLLTPHIVTRPPSASRG
jgi:hypothetical protein